MRLVLDRKQRQKMKAELEDDVGPMLIKGHYTICSHLRLLYRTPLTDQQKELCEEIIFLAKRMSQKLEQYR